MAPPSPAYSAAELERTTRALSALSLDSKKQTTNPGEAQVTSDVKEQSDGKDARKDRKCAEIDNASAGTIGSLDQKVPLPFILFVYGPLADPFFLNYTMKMTANPGLSRSSISGYRMKFSRRYPVPVPAPGKTITDFSIPIRNETQLRKITKWYAAAYKLVDCKIEVMRREGQDYAPSTKDWVPPRWVRDRVIDGKVFVWAWDVESVELMEGYWDEGWWEMERDEIMRIKKKTNTRELEKWKVKQRDRLDVWEDERQEKERTMARAEDAKIGKPGSKRAEERELGGLD